MPTGARRSTFTPPPAGVEPPVFDDDALADALAAQVASYTSPIPVLRPAAEPAPSAPAAESTDVPDVAPRPDAPETSVAPETPVAPVTSDVPEPDAFEPPVAESTPPAVEPSVSPTLEAIERLENELRRRAEEAGIDLGAPPVAAEPEPAAGAPSTDEPSAERSAEPGDSTFPPSGSLFPASPSRRAASPEDAVGPTAASTPEAEPATESESETESEPEADAGPESAEPEPEADPTPVFPFSPPTGAIPVVPAAPQPVPVSPSWLTEPPSSAPIDLPEPLGAPADAEPPVVPEPSAPEAVVPEPFAPEPFAPEPFAPESTPAGSAPEPSSVVAGPPPLVEPPAFAPPPGSEPVVPAPPVFATPFEEPPATPPVDLPPPSPSGAIDFAHLPPPIGLEPAPLPPYDPASDSAAVPAPHPDDLGSPPSAPSPFAPPSSEPVPFDPPVAPPSGPVPAVDADEDDDDAVDATDRASGAGAHPIESAGASAPAAPPSQPVPTARRGEDEPGLLDRDPEQHPALTIESAGPEPTALDLRAGRAARLFWLWFAANSSVISLSLGAVLFGLGMSLRQALVAILLGVALSFLPLGLVTLAGKWSGQPTMIVSRATFGVVGNVLPAVIAVLSRVFWGGALLWMVGAGVGGVLADAGLDAGLGEQTWAFVALGVGAVIVVAVAVFGYGLIARVQLVLSILTAVLVVGVIALTFPKLDIAAAQGIDDGPWTLLLGGAVLVFSFVGLAWVHSSADVARYQRPDSDGGSTMLWAAFGATVPAFVLVAWGALLAASDPLIADGLATNPLHTIAALLPVWYPAPLLAALALGLLSGAVLTVYSGGFALQSLGLPLRRPGTTLLAGGLVVVAGVLLLLVAGDARGLIRDVATTVGVPVAAWAGIFATEMMIRRRRFHAGSLLRRGGVYPDVRWVNLVGLVVIIGIGFGLTSAVLPGLDWQGYLLPLLGLAADDPLLTSDVGVLVALALGILLPLATAVPAIRRQERASVD